MGAASAGDADGDRDVDGTDFVFWRANFGPTPPAAAAASAASGPITDAELVSLAQRLSELEVTELVEKSTTRKIAPQSPHAELQPIGLNPPGKGQATPGWNIGSPNETAAEARDSQAVDAAFDGLIVSELRSDLF
jgi:hypothetical protein